MLICRGKELDAEVAHFADAVTVRAREFLGEGLHAAYLSGSVALGGYVPLKAI